MARFLSLLLILSCLGAVPAVAEEKTAGELWVDDFEDGDLESLLGRRWLPLTDQVVEGVSEVEVSVVATDGGKALAIQGEVKAGFSFPFAGGVTALGPKDREPRDLGAYRALRFRVRGDGNLYEVAVYRQAVEDHNDFRHRFVARSEWSEVTIPFADLRQSAFWGQRVPWGAEDLWGFGFQSNSVGSFAFEIDDIRFVRELDGS
ncbi:MAG: CIA30 family protein [Acidobacteriota bacterium]